MDIKGSLPICDISKSPSDYQRRIPGTFFLRWFQIHSPEQSSPKNSTILRLETVDLDRIKRQVYRCLRWMLLFFLLTALFYDMLDVVTGSYITNDLQTKYGNAEPVISLMTYCASQTALVMAGYTVLFLFLRRDAIVRSYTVLEELTVGSTTFVCTFIDPHYWRTFDEPATYGYIPIRRGLLSLYYRTTVVYCTLIHYAALSVFAYVNAHMLVCSQAIQQRQKEFLTLFLQLEGRSNFWKTMPEELYLEKLKLWLHYDQQLREVFEQLQKTFCWKLLLDTAALCLALMLELAYVSTWLLNTSHDLTTSGCGSVGNLVRHILYIVMHLLGGWTLLYRPLLLQKLQQARSDLINEKPTLDEVMVSMTLMHGTNSRQMLYNAGAVVPLGMRVVCTISAALFTFGWFVIDRSIAFKSKSDIFPTIGSCRTDWTSPLQ
ncbi:hypothetical protein BV898_05978 [Hypsibius exemplaris]|uniref:Uncharacterized protein n=1 Tax=Hypsibius exemplaris TaxID=2072580 RepID=A0A1W0WXT1_HYPEX|nr:hypothetical protein BV898_05978 [Hypsibius exemplaris]